MREAFELNGMTRTSFLRHRSLGGSKVLLQTGVLGINLETGLVRIVGAEQVACSVEGGALAAPALGPVWLDLGRLLGIFQGAVPLLLGGVGGRTVAVEDVVGGVDGNGLSELVAIRQRTSQSRASWVSTKTTASDDE